jgi:hypothetical protein
MQTRFPGYDARAQAFGTPEFPLAKRIASVAEKSDPVAKAIMYQILNSWGVFGSDYKLSRAYFAAAAVENAFQEGDLLPIDWVTFRENPKLPEGFVIPGPLPANEFIDGIVAAKSEPLRKFFLSLRGHSVDKPDVAHLKKLATLLDHSDLEIRANVTRRLSDYLDDPEHAPRRVEKVVDGEAKFDYPDLAEIVSYWKARLLKM